MTLFTDTVLHAGATGRGTSAGQSIEQAEMPQVEAERKRRMQEAWQAYHGEFVRPLKVAANQPDDNVLSNRCAAIVDKGVSFLFGKPLAIEAVDETPQASCLMQEAIEAIWGDVDDRMTLLSKLAINGAVCGQAFVRLIPSQEDMTARTTRSTESDEEEGESEEEDVQVPRPPRLVILDPLLVRMVTPPDDYECILAFILEYPLPSGWQRRQVISRLAGTGAEALAMGQGNLLPHWTITDYVRRHPTSAWLPLGTPEIWSWPFPPILTCQNLPNPNETWGTPDLTPDLINQNRVLNFIQSNTSRILKFHAHPKTYAVGVAASQINLGVDDLICLPTPDSKLANLEMQSDLASSLNFAAMIRSDMDEQSRVPAVALGRLTEIPRGNLSGVALQLLFQPLIEKTTQKQRLYGRLIREVTRASLCLMGLVPASAYTTFPVELHWQSLLPIDDLAAAQTALLLKQIGVSQATILAQLGYNPSDEAEKVAAESARRVPSPGETDMQEGPEELQTAEASPFLGREA